MPAPATPTAPEAPAPRPVTPPRRLAAYRTVACFTAFALVFGGLLLAPMSVAAQNMATTTARVNLRSGPGPEFSVLTVLPQGATVSVDGAATNGYLPVTWQGTSGYAGATWLTTGSTAPPPTTGGPTGTAFVTAERLNVRSGPGLSSSVVTIVTRGASVQLTGQQASGYRQITVNGTTGWVSADYISTIALPPPSTSTPAPSTPTSTPAPGGDTVPVGSSVTGSATVSANLNLRTGPGTGYGVRSVLPSGARVELRGSAQNGYQPLSWNGTTGWASATWLTIGGASTPTPTPTSTPAPGGETVPVGATATGSGSTTANVNLRVGPGLAYGVRTVIPSGTTVELRGDARNGYQPVAVNGATGWLASDWVSSGQASTPTPTPTGTATPTATATATATSTATPGGPNGEVVPVGTDATGSATVTANLNLRAGPGTGYDVRRVLPAGAVVELRGAAQNGFQPLSYNGTTGWAATSWLRSGGSATPTPAPTAPPTDGTTPQYLYTVRSGNMHLNPTTDSPVVWRIPPLTRVTITGPAQGDFYPARWAHVSGWLNSSFLSATYQGPSTAGKEEIVAIIYEAADFYGQPREDMLRVAQCESGLNPAITNRDFPNDPNAARGLFQFRPSTFASTPYRNESIFDARANAYAAAWMWSVGRRNEWACQ